MVNLDKILFQRVEEQLREVRIEKGPAKGPRREFPCKLIDCPQLVSRYSRSGLCKNHQLQAYRAREKWRKR